MNKYYERVSLKKKLILGVIYILFIAIFMTTFEVCLFILLLAPEETERINEWLYEKRGIFELNNEILLLILNNNDQSIINSIIVRENALIYKFNQSLVYIIVCVIISFVLLLTLVIQYLRNYVYKSVWDVVVQLNSALLTVVVLALFQYVLYIFAHKYRFTTYEEIVYMLSIRTVEYLEQSI